MTNDQAAHTGSDLMRKLVVGTGLLAMLLTAAGALYSLPTRPEEASAADARSAETAKPRMTTMVPDRVVHEDIYFDFKSTRLRADAARMLQDRAAAMTRTEVWTVLVTGYADRQGPPIYNRTLAQRRAEAVKQFLVELGVPDASVKVLAVGQEATLCDDPGKECQQLNRRVHVEIRRLGPVALAPLAPKTLDVAAP
jgi:outer membrane protein OmpA-like peptidoglycan-associated protein